MDLLAVYTTVGDDTVAQALAAGAVEQRLAACVQAEAIRSHYRWQGAVQHDAEVRLLFKTTRRRGPALVAWLRERHPYELPAIWAMPVADADPAYAAWVAEGCEPPAEA